MNNRPLFLVVALMATIIGIDAIRRHGGSAAPAPAPPQTGRAAATPSRQVPAAELGPSPAINQVTAGTPTLDLMARLAVRRRIAREGTLVYLDSLLAGNDSMVVRWPDRGGSPLTVAFMPDSTLPEWSEALYDDMRSAFRVWGSNDAGLSFREVPPSDSPPDIRVHWVTFFPDSGRVGLTTLSWTPEGEVRSADITLALQAGEKRPSLDPSTRRRVAAHELGHAIGLPHSADRGDLMFPGAIVSSPSRRDQATLQLLYAIPPGSVRTP